MVIYLNLGDSNYVTGHGSDDGDVKIELPKDHDFFNSDIESWKYENDELVYDEERNKKRTQEKEEEDSKTSDIERLEKAIMELAKISLN